ncbi:hypothetical protein V1525DRAFT_416792 [Lipomyces kononenkoae]|uniref:Uncharacterized protein n=1 Tax=Lipomyces kononenkoae TaxID=34357 RepID=A0ACC3T8R3_LIPKO
MRRQTETLVLLLLIIVVGVLVLRSGSSQSIVEDSILSRPVQPNTGFFGIGTCSNIHAFTSERATLLASIFNDDLTSSRVRFLGPQKYNSNLLPLPSSSKHQYFGLARSGEGVVHDVQWCFMRWKKVPITERKIVECTTPPMTLDTPNFRPIGGACKKWDWLEVDQGFLDPRMLFSPFGEPLMVVGSNSHEHCLGMYVIDLRVLVPELSQEMQLDHVPIRFDRYYELDSPFPEEISKNWFFVWDLKNEEYIHHNLKPPIVTSIQDPSVNIAEADQECISAIEHDNVHLHQATNALRLTLCDFPCQPTADNTVVISIAHIKRIRRMDILYERYLVVMNATSPFNIIGRSKNLVFAGMDESQMLYTVSIAWDTSVRTRGSWGDYRSPSGQERFRRSDSDTSNPRLARRDVLAPEGNLESPSEAPWARIQDLQHTLLREMPLQFPRNPIVTDFFHGWLNDIVMINFGIRDTESAVIHVSARDLVNCLVDCRVFAESTTDQWA